MRLPRMTTRWWIVAVALMAVTGSAVGQFMGNIVGQVAAQLVMLGFQREAPPSFDPAAEGAQSGQLIGLVCGTGLGLLIASTVGLARWRPRSTVRRWAAVVALVAVVLAALLTGERFWQLSSVYAKRRAGYAVDWNSACAESGDNRASAATCRSQADELNQLWAGSRPAGLDDRQWLRRVAQLKDRSEEAVRAAAYYEATARAADSRASYYEPLLVKYWRATFRPWLTVAPDPPEPK